MPIAGRLLREGSVPYSAALSLQNEARWDSTQAKVSCEEQGYLSVSMRLVGASFTSYAQNASSVMPTVNWLFFPILGSYA